MKHSGTSVLDLRTPREGMIDVTGRVQAVVDDAGVEDGLCTVFVPHTTAGVTINENADPDVQHDMLLSLERMVPELPTFRHAEGNSTAHVKASLMGSSVTVLVEGGRLRLGTWQGVYICEFDGPRSRKVWVRVSG